MKSYYKYRFLGILNVLSRIAIIGGIIILIPFFIGLAYHESTQLHRLIMGFVVPGAATIAVGFVLRSISKPAALTLKDSMFVCTFSWILLTLVGAIPFSVLLHISYLDGCFETMSGFTTMGITVLQGLDTMDHSILFWRALTQWIGGLGILSMFVLIGFKGGAVANHLFLAEGHKISTQKPSPSMFRTARILWILYIGFTFAEILILILLRLDLFDAVTHAFTTLSTGGYSIYDDSIAHYQISGHPNFLLIEITLMVFMLAGGAGRRH
jgi:trk system potassium uptake protein TrkH